MPRSNASRKLYGAPSGPSLQAISKAYTSLPTLEFPTFQQLVDEDYKTLRLPELLTPAPHFPTFLELVEQDNLPPPRSDRPKGLFEDLLGARPEAVYLHALEHGELYDDESITLLHELINGHRRFRDLTLAEQEQLDRATYSFATATPRPPRSSSPPLKKEAEAEDDEQEKVAEENPFEPEVPPEDMRPYWWI